MQTKKKLVLLLAALFSPDNILNKLIFVVENGSPLLNGFSNELYNVSNATSFLHVDKRVVIDGQIISVAKIMVCTEGWLKTYWINPMTDLQSELKRILDQEKKPSYGTRNQPSYSSSDYNSSNDSSSFTSFICLCGCFTICLILALIGFSSFVIYSYNSSSRCFTCPQTNTTMCDDSIKWDPKLCVSGCITTYSGNMDIITYSIICYCVAGAMLCIMCYSFMFCCAAEDKMWLKSGCGTFCVPFIVVMFMILAIALKHSSYVNFVNRQPC